MTMIENSIPYCAGCGKKKKREGLNTGDFFVL